MMTLRWRQIAYSRNRKSLPISDPAMANRSKMSRWFQIWLPKFAQMSIFTTFEDVSKTRHNGLPWHLNFQLWLQDCSAVCRDLKLKLRLNTPTSIGFRGSGYWANPLGERDQRSVKQHQIFTRDLVTLLFTFWPKCGECFAPLKAKSGVSKNHSRLKQQI